MSNIHPTALIDPSAEIADDVRVGAYSIIGPKVKIAAGNIIYPHCVFDRWVDIGEGNTFFSYCSIGAPPQDLSYNNDEETKVIIGKNNIFREYVSIHRGTSKQDKMTIVGDSNLVMAYAHLGHDVAVGNNCVIVNACSLAGHVSVGDKAIISGNVAISQFCRIGRGSFVMGFSAIDRDIPPFSTGVGNRFKIKGMNIIGLKRSGTDKKHISQMVKFVSNVRKSNETIRKLLDDAIEDKEMNENPLFKEFFDFYEDSKVGVSPFERE